MIYFVVQPMPGEVVIKQIVFDGILMVILGTIVAWLYRDRRPGEIPLRGAHSWRLRTPMRRDEGNCAPFPGSKWRFLCSQLAQP